MRVAGCLFLLLSLTGIPASAQKDDNATLTEEFSRMSPKERARVAREEQEAAKNDPAYQAVMQRGEEDFQNGRYDSAMTSFEEARRLRPLNVYPKVKIEDLHVLIRKRDAARAMAMDTLPAAIPDPPPPSQASRTIPAPEQRAVTDTATIARPKAQVVPSKATERQGSSTEATSPPLPHLPDGTSETRYKQGNADVTEITVTEHGHTTVYKRVAHKWGQLFYFEDGQAIDGRVWNERFGDKP